jgi:serine/threonine protein kinase
MTSGDVPAPAPHVGPPSVGEDLVRRRVVSQLFGGPPPRIGRYSLLSALGRGGMGAVFAAYDEKLDRKVAIKLLHREDPKASDRLVAEARSLARVVHPNVVGVHDVLEEGGRVYIAMEYVRGEDLRQWLAAERSWRDVVEVFLQAGRGRVAGSQLLTRPASSTETSSRTT